MMFVQDNKVQSSRTAVYEHLMRRVSDWQTRHSSKAMIASLCTEMQVKDTDVLQLIDAARDTDGKDAIQVTEIIWRYAALLPPV